jgi:hypothetical protein
MTTAVSAPNTITFATLITICADRCVGYAEMLCKDIPAEKFGHMSVPTLSHPAFNIGHLSLYPNRVLTLIGRTDCVKEKAGWDKLFAAGCACVEQDGRYPAKDELIATYVERYRTTIAAINESPDEIFARPNPMEGRMRELFPSVGFAVNFMMNNHPMMHLGQVSAWRRTVGLPSAM